MVASEPSRPPERGTLPGGTLFQGAYEIVAELGAGSFGRVYGARQLSTGQMVAIKVLRLGSEGAPAEVAEHSERFRREMRLCAELSHPNIVRLIDCGQSAEGALYAVFQHVPGATLRDILAQEGSLGWEDTLHLMTEVLDALACAHARGVVHRDLKPENIMVTRTGAQRNALVVDFGLGGFSRNAQDWALPRLTASHEFLGTPCYAAPEQLRGEPPSPRSDLYSWGLIFLECLTGETAIRGSSAHEVVLKQLGPEPVPIPPAVRDRRLRALLETVTAKRIEKRAVTADSLLRSLGTLPRPAPARAPREAHQRGEAERRQLTIVCCALAARTRDGAAPDVEELDEALHAQHAAWEELATHAGGRMAAVLGGRVLLVFGYPQAHEDDARRAARVALQVAAEVAQASLRVEAPRGLALEVRIGVHTGLVIVREHGPALAGEPPELLGATPQVATRLAELAQPGEVLASVETERLLRGGIRSEPVGEHVVPEISRPLAVFRLRAEERSHAGGGTVSLVRETPLVGRWEQLGQLLAVWRRTQAHRGGAVLISGEPGIGKSRLVRELRRRVPDDAWLEARCVPENQDSPLRPIADLFPLGDPLDRLLERHGFDVAESLPVLAAALSRPLDERWPRSELPPDRQKELALNTILRLVCRMTEERPLVVVLEDLHWADPTTLEVVSQLVREADAAQVDGERAPRILLVATARPEFSAPWRFTEVAHIPLARLSHDEVETMLRAGLVNGRPLPRTVLEQVFRRTDGVPLFVEELTRVLLEAGVLGEEAGDHVVGVEIPGTLRDLLTARLDTLSASARATAQLASVLGREFAAETLRAASTKEASLLDEDLCELVAAGIAYQRRSALGETYVFRHALVRDAAYESLVRSARQELHRRVATTLRERFPEVERSQPDLLAHHFEYGGELEAAVHYWKRAGDRTMARAAYAESIRLLRRGLALLERMPPSRQRTQHELALTESLGTAYFLTRGYTAPEVERTFGRALELCDELGQDVPVRVLHGFWVVQLTRSDREATARLLPRFHQLAERSGDPVAFIAAHANTGLRALLTGNFVAAREEMAKATEWYDTEGYRAFFREYGYDGGLYAFAYLMWIDWILGYPDRSLAVREQAFALAERNANPYSLLIVFTNGAVLAHHRREANVAWQLSERVISIARDQKLYYWLGLGMCLHGWAAVWRGDVDEGTAEIREGVDHLSSAAFRTWYGYYRSFLAEADLARGTSAEGMTAARESLALTETLLDRFYEGELHRLEGELLRLQGDLSAAEASFRTALEITGLQRAKGYELRAATSLARLLHEQGTHDEARRVLAPVHGWFTEGHDTHDVRAAAALLGRLG